MPEDCEFDAGLNVWLPFHFYHVVHGLKNQWLTNSEWYVYISGYIYIYIYIISVTTSQIPGSINLPKVCKKNAASDHPNFSNVSLIILRILDGTRIFLVLLLRFVSGEPPLLNGIASWFRCSLSFRNANARLTCSSLLLSTICPKDDISPLSMLKTKKYQKYYSMFIKCNNKMSKFF